MKVPAAKVEKAVSKDQSRPVLCSLYLRVLEPATEDEPGRGLLEGTDSYKLTRVPVVLEPGDVEGFVDPAAIAAARKADRHAPAVSCNGTLDVRNGPSFLRTLEGQFPNTDSLIPDSHWSPDGVGEPFEIGLSAKLLYELAQSLGTDTVALSFCRPSHESDGPETHPSRLRPMTVRPFGGKSDPDAIGILMPIRLKDR